MQTLIQLLLDKRYFWAGLMLLISAGVCWGLQYTTLDSTPRSILSEDDPYKAQVDQARLDFPPSTSVLFAFQHPDGVFNLPTLQAIDDLTSRFTEIDSAISVGSLLNRRFNDGDAKRYGRDYLIPLLSEVTEADLSELRRIALADEDLTTSLLAPQGDMTLAVVKYRANEDEQATRLRIAESVLEFRDYLRETYPGVEIYVLGNVLFELDGHKAQIKDSTMLMPLVIFTSILLLWFCLRSLAYALCLFVIAFLTIGLAVGTFGWSNIALNQISTLGPLVVFVIAIADGIHIVSVYAQGLHKGLNKMEAMRESLAINIQPVTLATITTTMGFLSLNYCTSPGIYGFGNIVAVGVLWAFLVTLALLPTLVLLLPTNKVPKPLGIRGFVDYIRSLVATRGNLLFWCSALLIAVTLAMLPLNKVDFNRFSFVDEDSDFHHVITALAEKIGNDQSLAYSIHSGAYYGITEPGFLEEIDKFSLWLEEQPEASFVRSYTDFLRSANRSDHDDDEAYDVLPEDKLQLIDYLVGYQLIQEIEPNLESIFNTDYSAIKLVVGTSNLSNRELLNFNDRIDTWIAANLNPQLEVMHADNSILYARLDRAISVELLTGFSLSFLLITLTLLVGLRSVRYGLLSIMPNLFPATIVFGFWGLFVGELSPYIMMLFSISIGIVVDDSVHVLSKYISARKEGKLPEQAVQYSLDKAGSAITITTLSLAFGTILLVFSNTFYFQNVALLLTPIIVVALLLDLLFLPPLLVKFDNWLEKRSPAVGVQALS